MAENKYSRNDKNDDGDYLSLFAKILFNAKRGILLLLICALIGGIIGFTAGNESYQPGYTSSCTIVVSASGSITTVYSNLNTASAFADVFNSFLNSNLLINRMRERLEGKIDEININARLIDETNLIIMTAKSDSPTNAYLVAKTCIECYPEFTDRFMSNAYMDVLRQPAIPSSPDNANMRGRYCVIGAVIGFALALAVIVLESAMTDKVYTEEDCNDMLDSDRLCTIRHETKGSNALAAAKNEILDRVIHRKGNDEDSILINKTGTTYYFVESFKIMRTSLEYKMKKNNDKRLVVTSVFANEGKTTMSVNLAISFAQKGYRVLLVDGDLVHPSIYPAMKSDIDERKFMRDFYRDSTKEHKLTMDDFSRHKELGNLFLLMSNTAFSKSTEQIITNFLKNFTQLLTNVFDYIIIDAPPMSVSADAEAIAAFCDGAVVAVRQNFAGAATINQSFDSLRDACRLYGYVFNNVLDLPFSATSSMGYYSGLGRYSYGYGYGYGYGDAKKSRDEIKAERKAEREAQKERKKAEADSDAEDKAKKAEDSSHGKSQDSKKTGKSSHSSHSGHSEHHHHHHHSEGYKLNENESSIAENEQLMKNMENAGKEE